MPENPAEKVMEQMIEARGEAKLWPPMQSHITQSADQMTTGLTPPVMPLDARTLQANLAQQQTALQMQNMAQVQMNNLQAYAQGVPGSTSPSFGSMNPMAANYQLQNMYMMNPYMANFFAGGGGGGGGPGAMNLVSPQMMTTPRLGIFRNMPGVEAGQIGGADSIIRDVVTLGWFRSFLGERSFPAYQDVLDERIEASRRMTRRAESLVASTASIAPMVAGFLPGVGIPLALGLEAAGVAIGGMSNAYFQRRAETGRIQDISRQLTTGAQSRGFRNQGFSLGEAAQMMLGIRREAAGTALYNVSDYMQVLEEGTAAGVFNFNATSRNTMDKLKGIIRNIDVFMTLSGDPDVQSAMQRLGQLQNLGVQVSDAQGALTSIKAFARLAGTSVDTIMSTSGAYGAQIAAQQGAPAIAGMMAGGLAQGLVTTMIQEGAISPLAASIRGGASGMTQQTTQALVNTLHSAIGGNIASFVREEQGKFVLDQDAINSYFTSGKVPGGDDSLMQSTQRRLREMPQEMHTMLLRQQEDLTARVMSQLSPMQMLNSFRARVGELKKYYGDDADVRDILYTQYGMAEDMVDYLMSPSAMANLQAQTYQANATAAGRRRNRFYAERSWVNRIAVGFNQGMDWLTGLLPFEDMARQEQIRAMDAAGMGDRYVYGMEYGAVGREAAQELGDIRRNRVPAATRNQIADSILERESVRDYIRGTNQISYERGESVRPGGAVARHDAWRLYQQSDKFLDTWRYIDSGKKPADLSIDAMEDTIDSIFSGGSMNISKFLQKGEAERAAIVEYLDTDKGREEFGDEVEALDKAKNIMRAVAQESVSARARVVEERFNAIADIYGMDREEINTYSNLMSIIGKVNFINNLSASEKEATIRNIATDVMGKGRKLTRATVQESIEDELARQGKTLKPDEVKSAVDQVYSSAQAAYRAGGFDAKTADYLSKGAAPPEFMSEKEAGKSQGRFNSLFSRFLDYTAAVKMSNEASAGLNISGMFSTTSERSAQNEINNQVDRMWSNYKDSEGKSFSSLDAEKAARAKWEKEKSAQIKEVSETAAITAGALDMNRHSSEQNGQIVAVNSSRQVNLLEELVGLARKEWS